MKTHRLAVLVFLLSILVGGIPSVDSGQIVEDNAIGRALQPRGVAPLHFIPNQGQLGEHIKYYAKNSKQEIYFTDDGVYLAIAKGKLGSDPLFDPRNASRTERHTIETQIIRLAPVNMIPQAEIAPEDLRQAKVNWYMGNDLKRWRTGIPTYGAVTYLGAQNGVDLKFYGQDRQLEYDLLVNPGQDPSQVRMSCSGVDYFELTEEGDLVINLKGGATLIQKKPRIYQVVNGDRVNLDGGFRVEGPVAAPSRNGLQNLASSQSDEMVYGFDVGSYDRSLPVVIDPVIMYADYLELGGAGEDYAMGIDVDSTERAYMAGYTWSTSQSLTDLKSIPLGTLTTSNYNVFVKKFDENGGDQHTTYIGGNNDSRAYAIASDATGNVYITGQTSATGSSFPLKDALYSTNRGNGDAFLTKLYADGTLAFSTFLGGTREDMGYGIAVDSSGSAYITGYTYSLDFPRSTGAFCTTHSSGEMDAFITKINTVSKTLAYSTLLGREANNSGTAIAVDSDGAAYVTGWTYSSDFPLAGSPFQYTYRGMQDAFVLKLAPTGSTLIYSSFLGGTDADVGMGIAVDSSGYAYVTGKTDSTDFPLRGYRALFGSTKKALTDGFVAKVNPSGSAMPYSLYLGGNDVDIPHGIRVNAAGEAFIVGETASSNFPMANAFQGTKDSYRAAFVTKLDDEGNNALFSSYYLGNSGNDKGTGIALDKSSTATGVYFTGYTTTADQYSNAFAVKLNDISTPSITVVSPNGGESIQAGQQKTIRWSYTYSPDTTVKIELVRNGVVVSTLATGYTIGTGGNGYYIWTVPCDQEADSTYRIKITTSNETYYDQSDKKFTISQAIPNPEFTANGVDVSYTQIAVAVEDEVQFQDLSSCGTPTHWAWDFGDGKTSSEQNPKHKYKAVGQYDVSLKLTGDGWERTRYKFTYMLVSVPNPIFSASDNPAGVNKVVTFTNTSTGTVTSWLWTFGDGTTSVEQNPTHTYAAAGTYTVTLKATGPSGSRSKDLSLEVVGLPTADFSSSPAPAAVEEEIQFTDASTGYVSTRTWTFGDGETSTDKDPKHTYHTYPAGGTYSVKLKLTNPAGNHSVTKLIDVSLPNPQFSASDNPAGVNKEVTFTNDTTGTVDSYDWDFGDGTSPLHTTDKTNPTHTYATAGSYTVTLKATGPSVDRTKTLSLQVVDLPTADFSAAPAPAAVGDEIQFTDTSTGYVSSRSWSFGDAGTSTDKDPKHTYTSYPSGGTYSVRLTLTNPAGSHFVEKTINVGLPNPDFTATPNPVGVDGEVAFSGSSSGTDLSSWKWDFGDGTTVEYADTDPDHATPKHTYTSPGDKTVTLTVTGATGSRSKTKTIRVVECPVAAFTFTGDPNPVAMGAAVQFTDGSAGEITSRAWDFGDGNTSNEQNPQHAFSADGNYTVTLTVTGPGGTNSTTHNITVTLPTITVISPNGTEILRAGDNVTIRWDYAGSVGSQVKILLLKAGVRVATVTLGTPVGSSSYNYVIPAQRTPGTDYRIKVVSTSVAAYQDTSDSDFTITAPAPVAAFSGLPRSGNPPLSVKFSNTTTGTVDSWDWDFGEGGTSQSTSPTYPFGPGAHTVKLTATGPGGTSVKEKIDYIKVNPAADFKVEPSVGYEALTVQFTDDSNGGDGHEITSWLWNFGDGTTSTDQNPTHTYTTKGKYDVTLKVTNDIGSGTTVKSSCVKVLLADFTATPVGGSAPLDVSFTDISEGSPTDWTWDFGDDEHSDEQNPQHTYAAPGVYTVTLTVSGLKGTGTETKTNYITTKPKADFSADATVGYEPFNVSFTDASLGDVSSWVWNFGDGATSTVKNPSHIYTTPGTYPVTLTVHGLGGGDTETKTGYITVYLANFSGTPRTGIGSLTTAFTDLSGGSPTGWEWDFGDGSEKVIDVQNPTHTYSTSGLYTVSLKVTGSGVTGQQTKSGYISIAPDADFTASTTLGYEPLAVHFTDATAGAATSWAWNFGDGTTSTLQNPNHVYTTAGTYTVTLTVTGDGGSNTETKTGHIKVYSADFSASTRTGTGTLTTTFSDLSTGSPTTWLWDFGDGTTSDVMNPSHTYSSPGVYNVSLTVWRADGTFGTETKLAYITVNYPATVANFSAVTRSGPSVLNVAFTNTSTGLIENWYWDFGDGTIGAPEQTEQNPTHAYTTPGTYTVKLTASGLGGTNTKTQTNYVTVTAPSPNFAATTARSGPSVLTVGFADSSTGTVTWRKWEFGDGTTSEGNDLIVSHDYATPGTYTVKLTITAQTGTTYSKTQSNYITVTAPVANFSPTSTTGTAPLTVQFTDSSTGTLTSRTWDFGDGTEPLTTTDLIVSHTYTNVGAYTVRLTAYGPAGGPYTKTGTVQANTPITVTSPNTATVSWTRPCTKTIKWTYSGDPSVVGPDVKVELLYNGLPIDALTKTVPITNLSTTMSLTTSDQWGTNKFKIRVTSTSNSTYTDMSNAFFSIY